MLVPRNLLLGTFTKHPLTCVPVEGLCSSRIKDTCEVGGGFGSWLDASRIELASSHSTFFYCDLGASHRCQRCATDRRLLGRGFERTETFLWGCFGFWVVVLAGKATFTSAGFAGSAGTSVLARPA
jgi:hypothetical protein